MFTTNLDTLKVYQNELRRQADHYRLAKSLEQPGPMLARIYHSLGRILINSGQQLINNSQAAAH